MSEAPRPPWPCTENGLIISSSEVHGQGGRNPAFCSRPRVSATDPNTDTLGGTPTPPSCYMLGWHPTSKISSMTFFPQQKAWSKKPPPDGTQAQKLSHEKFFWDLDDGGHRGKVGKPLKASSDGRWGRSWLSAQPRDRRGWGGPGSPPGEGSRRLNILMRGNRIGR